MKKLFDLTVLIIVSPLLLLLGALIVSCVVVCSLLVVAASIPVFIIALFVKAVLRNNQIYDGSNIKVSFFKTDEN